MPTSPQHPHTLHAFFGGTFDPIHYGHLRPVAALAEEVGLDKVTLLPNHVPPHRPQPEANAQQRLTMVELAIAGNPLFTVDDRELHRTTASYTIETFETIRKERGAAAPLAFIIGPGFAAEPTQMASLARPVALLPPVGAGAPGLQPANGYARAATLVGTAPDRRCHPAQPPAARVYLPG